MYDKYGPEILFFGCSVLSGLGVGLLASFRFITWTCSSTESAQVNVSRDNLLPESDEENEEISERSSILRTDCDYGTSRLNTGIQNS